MRYRSAGRMLLLSGAIPFLLLLANGCHSTHPLAVAPAGESIPSIPSNVSKDELRPVSSVVQPGAQVEWALRTVSEQPGQIRAGKAQVGPDGTLLLGPYGSCKVDGLTLEQARSRVEKQLAVHVKQPQVTLKLSLPASAPVEIAWKKASDPSAWSKIPEHSLTAVSKNNPIHSIAFQDPALPQEDAKLLPLLPIKEKEEIPPTTVQPPIQGQPIAMKHGGHRERVPVPVAPLPMAPPPPAPNEMHPVLLPSYIIRPPDVLLIESQKGLLTQPIRGQHLVRPDGSVGVGIYGPVLVAGKTVSQAREDLARVIHAKLDPKQIKYNDVLEGLSVDVLAYNSSVYYIITDGAGLGEQVYRFPVTGSETVLDAISHINGLPVVSSPKRIWVARRNPGHGVPDHIYPVDWKGISQMGAMNTNWQVMPGDRIYVQADPVRRFNNNLSKFLEPVERVLGATLLGAQTNNALRGVVSR